MTSSIIVQLFTIFAIYLSVEEEENLTLLNMRACVRVRFLILIETELNI